METLRYAIIGVGGIANTHLNAFSRLPGVETVGISDPSEPALRTTSERFPTAVASADAATMLKESQPDIVSICTPNKFHRELTRLAFEAGAHVACEKPMAMTLDEAMEMDGFREQAGKLGLINFSYRNCLSFRFARALISTGELGEIHRINAVYLQSHLGSQANRYSWRNDASIAGFGALGDLGIHMIDSAAYLTGLTFRSVVGKAQILLTNRPDAEGVPRAVTADTNAAFLAEFENGMLGTFETTQVAPGYGNHFRIEVSGTKGTLSVLSERETEIALYAGSMLTHYATWSTSLPWSPVPTEFARFQGPSTPAALAHAVRGEQVDYPSFADGVRAQRVLDAILRSMQSGSWIHL